MRNGAERGDEKMQQRKKVKTEGYKKAGSEVYLSCHAEDRRRNQYL